MQTTFKTTTLDSNMIFMNQQLLLRHLDPRSIIDNMDASALESFLSVSGPLCTLLQFLTGVPLCAKYVRRRTTGESSALPFVAGALNCAVWTLYGLAVDQSAIQTVNGVGALLMASYSICFYNYTHRKATVLRQMVFSVGFFTTLCFVLNRLRLQVDEDEAADRERTILGYLAAGLSVAFCAAPLSSVGHVVRTRSTEALPFLLIFMTFLVTAQWWLFGVVIDDGFVTYPNMIGCLLAGMQLVLFIVFPAKSDAWKRAKRTSSEEELL